MPPSGSTDMVNAIQRAGGKRVWLTVYREVGHAALGMAWREDELVEWVFEQRRPPHEPHTTS